MKIKKINYYSLLIHSMLILLSCLVVILVKQNNDLKKREYLKPMEQIKSGDLILPIKVNDVSNKQDEISFKSKRTVLFIFSSGCRFCKENLSNWESLYNKYKAKYSVLSISTSKLVETQNFIIENKLEYPVYLPIQIDFTSKYKINGVPQTIIINSEGKVEYVWRGLLNSTQLKDIEQVLSL